MGNDLGATTVIFPNICHAMMLDPDWIIVAETILGVIQNKKQEVEKYRISLIVKVVVSKNIYFLFVQVIRYCSVPDHHHFE